MDGFFFPHACTITRPNPVDTRPLDTESGQPIGESPAPLAVYSGRCCFDGSVQSIRRALGGDVDVEGKAVLRLPQTDVLFDQDSDTALITANGRRYDGVIILKVSYNRRRTVLVVDLKQRPTLA